MQGALHEFDGLRGGGQPAALRPVDGQHRVDSVRRNLLGQLGPDGAVALAGTLDAGGRVMAGDGGESHRVTAQYPVQAVIGRDYLQ